MTTDALHLDPVHLRYLAALLRRAAHFTRHARPAVDCPVAAELTAVATDLALHPGAPITLAGRHILTDHEHAQTVRLLWHLAAHLRHGPPAGTESLDLAEQVAVWFDGYADHR